MPAANMSMSGASSMVMRAVPRLVRLRRLGSNVGQPPTLGPTCNSLLLLMLPGRQDCSVAFTSTPPHTNNLVRPAHCLDGSLAFRTPKGAQRSPPIPLPRVATPSLEGLSRHHHSPF